MEGHAGGAISGTGSSGSLAGAASTMLSNVAAAMKTATWKESIVFKGLIFKELNIWLGGCG